MVAVTHTVVANRGMMLFRLPEAGGLIGDGVSRPDTQEMDQRREHAQLLATTFAASALKERKMVGDDGPSSWTHRCDVNGGC
jgi:hypothetical protein